MKDRVQRALATERSSGRSVCPLCRGRGHTDVGDSDTRGGVARAVLPRRSEPAPGRSHRPTWRRVSGRPVPRSVSRRPDCLTVLSRWRGNRADGGRASVGCR